MRWLKHTISILLVLGAAGVILATAFSDHSSDYGRASLPQGGTVHLPKGKVTVYMRLAGSSSDVAENSNGNLAFAVTPAGGGTPIAASAADGQTSDVSVTRSETIGEVGAIAKLDVPSSGDYIVTGSTDRAPGVSYLEFGTNAGSAVLQRWKLIAGLLLGALLLAVIPVPRSGRRWDAGEGQTGWSSDPRAPYAG
jgi:hypothetical protein